MPVVPLAQPTGRIAPLRAPRQSPNVPDATAELGAAIGQVGRVLGQIAQQEQQRADRVKVQDAESQWLDLVNRRLHQDEDGYLSAQGMDAGDRKDSVLEELGEARKQLSTGLDQRQREAFLASTDSPWRSTQSQIWRHADRERERVYLTSFEARVEKGLDRIAGSWDDPKVRDDELVGLSAAAIEEGDRRGQDPQAFANEQLVKADQVILEAMLGAEDYQGAEVYLERPQVRERAGREAERYRRVIRAGKREAQVSRAADELVSKTIDPGTGRVDIERAFAAVDKRFKPGKLQDAVRDAVMGRARLAHSDWQGRSQKAYATAYQAFELGGRRWAAIPVRARRQLLEVDPDGYERLRRLGLAEQRARQRGGRGVSARGLSSADQLFKLRYDMASNPAKYRTMDGATFDDLARRLDLSPRDTKTAQVKFLSLTEAGTREQERRVNHDPILLAEARRAGVVKGARPGPEERRLLDVGEDRLEEFQRSFRDEKGRWPSAAEVRTEVDRLLTKGEIVDGGWLGIFDKGSTLLGAITEGQEGAFTELPASRDINDPVSELSPRSVELEGGGATGEEAEKLLEGVLPEQPLPLAIERSMARAVHGDNPEVPVVGGFETPPEERAALLDYLRPLEEEAKEERTGIPIWFRRGAEAELRRRGWPVGDEAVERAWDRWGGGR
ncbi:MAG: hypothetical protein P1V51_22395 [Deltaproteobacteria bacterium]|nr:hypothetical protein [Deltaproteobacteria bacterium]